MQGVNSALHEAKGSLVRPRFTDRNQDAPTLSSEDGIQLEIRLCRKLTVLSLLEANKVLGTEPLAVASGIKTQAEI